MENDQQQEKQTAEGTEEIDGHPRVDSTTRGNTAPSGDIIRHPIPNPASEGTSSNTQVTNESSGEHRNSSFTTEDDAIYSSIQNQGTSNSSPSILLFTKNSEFPLPFITLTPVAPESLAANSTQYLHFFMTYNADGTVTALPIYPYEPTATVGDRSHNQLPGFQGAQALSHYAYKTQDSTSSRQIGAQSNVPELQGNAPIDQDVAPRNASVFETITQSNVSAFHGNQSDVSVFHGNQSNVSVFHGNQSDMSAFHGNQSNVPVFQSNASAFQSNASAFQSNVPTFQSNVPSFQSNVPSFQSNVPAFQSNVPAFQSNVPSFQSNVPSFQSDVPAFQSNVPAFQSNVTAFQSNMCNHQEVSQKNGSVFQSSTQSNTPVFLGFQSNEPAHQVNNSNAPPYPGSLSNYSLNLQGNESNLTYLHENHSTTPAFQKERNYPSIYPDVRSNFQAFQNDQSNGPVFQNDQSNGPVFQNDQSNGPVFQNDQSNRSVFIFDGVLPKGIGHHASVEPKLVEAVRAIALENPRFIGLFSNKNECRHRDNKQTPGEDFKKNFPISEIPLPPSPISTTTLNKTNLPDTSAPTGEPQVNFSISEIPLPLGSPPAQSSSEPKFPYETSALAETPLNSAVNFERNFLLSEILLPRETDYTKNLNEAKISGVTSPAVIPQINPLEESFGANIPISEIPLPCNPLHTKFSNENEPQEPSPTPSPVIYQINTAENFGNNFPVSEIPLPLGPLPEDGPNRKKLSEVALHPSTLESSTNAQKCVTIQDETRAADEYDQISSEFAKKCTIDRDEFENSIACDWEERMPQYDLGLDLVNNSQSFHYKIHSGSKFENRSSVNANKCSMRSTSLKISSNQAETPPKILQQESGELVDSKKNSTRSESEVEAELKKILQSSKLSTVETENDVLNTNDTETRTHPKPTSLEIDKDTQMGKREISTIAQTDSERLIKLKEKIDSPKSKVERKQIKNDSKLFVAMSEKRTLEATETEKEPKAVLVSPQVDVASGMDKIEIPNIIQKGVGDSKWKLERRKKSTNSRTTARESNDVDTKSTSITADLNNKANKLDIPRIHTTKPNKPNETLTLSRLQADISLKGAKDSDVKVKLIKPTTKKGLEQILFSNNCVAVSGKTTLVESGMREESGPTKHVPAAVLRSLYRHRNSIQQFIGDSSSVEGHAEDAVVTSGTRAENISRTEHKAKTGNVDVEAASTTSKSSNDRKQRSKKKKAKESLGERAAEETRDGFKKDFEPDVTG